MNETLEQLNEKINVLRIRIEDTKSRLPAHSTKPPIMMELLDLEEEYDVLCKKLDELKSFK